MRRRRRRLQEGNDKLDRGERTEGEKIAKKFEFGVEFKFFSIWDAIRYQGERESDGIL
jgi:hypothetical protein